MRGRGRGEWRGFGWAGSFLMGRLGWWIYVSNM